MATKKNIATGPKARLMKKNLTQLKAQAKKLKIKGFSTKKKAQLVQSILMAQARTKKSAAPKKRISRSKIGTSFSMAGSRSKKRMVRKRGAAANRVMKKPVRMAGKRMMAGYNGWSNYETWLVNMYFEQMFQEIVDEEMGRSVHTEDDAYELGLKYRDIVDELNEEVLQGDGSYFIQDLVNQSMREVNWTEIAKHYIE